MKYLVIETINDETGREYTHFILLRKDEITKEITYFVNHLYWTKQRITKCYFSSGHLTNW